MVGLTWNRSCLANEVVENGSRSITVLYDKNKATSHNSL